MSDHAHDPALDPIESNIITIREAVIAHEDRSHEGERCSKERANAIAYLAHGLMLTPEEWVEAVSVFGDYMRRHDRHSP